MNPIEETIPDEIQRLYEIHEWRHASAILSHDFPAEWKDILDVLGEFPVEKVGYCGAGR